ncbi:ATPase, AAA family protein [Trichomonas vaginalis G3]|uniref:ATPase, AAA family protein n=1 Tax=Trichomonas vaginalis (strain ATCC PRA-98 / G3) TaxID=412133 RepID=A2D945_TRIV3|nr:ATP binding [Trichomonas vaginalis G3]EAY23071.1 ATPase, AAA family protein [Trichomonas vaginalis G3]KAI5519039.1 ATP binding [Trichomonas vaginalis G3]|eukprot:XP_001584057.1 ATPase, AAA family protein [Trichomonas vaginalis G3]
MSQAEILTYLTGLFKEPKVRILVEGPTLCGKTTTILKALESSGRQYIHLTVAQLFIDPNVQTMSILDKFITNGYLIFLDDIDTIFPLKDPDFVLIQRFFSRKPNVIAATRDKNEIHPFASRYFRDVFIMEQPPTKLQSENIAHVTFDDIGGAQKAKDTVMMMASWSVLNAKKISSWGLKPPSGAILYGPPGTGKTLLAKAAANACHCSFFSIAIPDLLRCLVGESEKRLTRTFEIARANAPSIVFIDEVQALFGRRAERRGDSNRLVVQLLAQLDLSSKNGTVFCLAATNAIEAVDPALLQPGRFEEVIEVSLPSLEDREDIVRVVCQKIKHENDVDENRNEIARLTEGMTASDINGICQKAAIAAMMDGRDKLALEDIKNEIKNEAFKRFRTGKKISVAKPKEC